MHDPSSVFAVGSKLNERESRQPLTIATQDWSDNVAFGL